MKQYLNLLKTVLAEGTRQANRTGIDAITTTGEMMKFKMSDGFPAVTTKRLAFKAVKGELLGFLRAYDNAADFRALGCNIWDQNANEDGIDPLGNVVPNKWLTNPNRKGTDDLGRIYGVTWRGWRCADGSTIDQVAVAIKTILTNPENRRIIISGWRPDEFDQMALPPCHVMYEFTVNIAKNELNLAMFQRSCDMFLGVPFNVASASLMLHLFAKLTGLNAGSFTHFLVDTHIYTTSLEGVATQLAREPFALPTLKLSDNIKPLKKDATDDEIDRALRSIEPSDIELENYQCHAAIKAPMAV